MREIRQSGSEGGAAQTNAPFLPPIRVAIEMTWAKDGRRWDNRVAVENVCIAIRRFARFGSHHLRLVSTFRSLLEEIEPPR